MALTSRSQRTTLKYDCKNSEDFIDQKKLSGYKGLWYLVSLVLPVVSEVQFEGVSNGWHEFQKPRKFLDLLLIQRLNQPQSI